MKAMPFASRIVQAFSAFLNSLVSTVEFTQSPTPTTALMLASKVGGLEVKAMFLLSTIHFIRAE